MTPSAVMLFDDAPVFGGAERYLELLATHLDSGEFAPSVVLAREAALDPLAGRLAQAGLPVARLPRVPTLRDFRPFLTNLRHFAFKRPRILHFNLVDPRACNGAIVAARLTGHRAIIATNQLPQSPFDDLPTPRRHRMAMAAIWHHVVVSEAARSDLAAHGVAHEKITVVRNCIDDPGPSTAARRASAREALGISGDPPLVGFAGRLVAQKNPRLFLEAAALAVRSRADTRFVLIGDGPERGALEDLARSSGIADRVRFAGHRTDALELYPGLDLMVFTSRYEGIPFSALEAMALGIPIVAARIPGIDEAVLDGFTGRLVSSSARDLASAILALLADEKQRAEMGQGGRMRALEHFSVQGMVEKTAAVYRKLLARG